jgi:hypothetical protein
MRMKERLYLTEDRSRAVKEEDRSGRHLLCKKGAELDDKVAARYGIVDGALPLGDKKSEAEEIVIPEVRRVEKSTKKVKK